MTDSAHSSLYSSSEELSIEINPQSSVEIHAHSSESASPSQTCAFNPKKYALSLFPPRVWVPTYQLKTFLIRDFLAGLTVGFMLIPQAMAYAIVASLPPIHGLYASIFATTVYMLFGTSRQLAVGPVAMVSLLVTSSVSSLAGVEEPGDEVYIGYVLLLTLMVGVFQLLMGLLRVGVVVNYLSHSVISGFTSAAAIIIGWGQLKYVFGVSPDSEEFFHMKVVALFHVIGDTHWLTLGMAVASIIVLYVIKVINRKKKWIIPGSLIAVVLSIIISFAFKLEDNGVKIIGDIPAGFPTPKAPTFSWDTFVSLLLPTVIISLVGYMESVAVAQKIATKKEYAISPTQELIALGLANIATSFFQGYPVTGGFSRTAVADSAGAQTPLYNVFAAIIVTATLLFLTKIIYYLCLNTLAAIILVAVVGLLDYETVLELWHINKRDLALLVLAFLSTLFIGIEIGLGIAVGISMIFVIITLSRPHISIMGKLPGSKNTYRNVKRYKVETYDGLVILRIDSPIFFANITYLKDKILKKISKDEVKAIILDMSGVNELDSSGVIFLEDLKKIINKMEKKIYLASPIGPVRSTMRLGKLDKHYGRKGVYWNLSEAIDHFHHRKKVTADNYSPYVFDFEEKVFSSSTE